MRAPTTPLVSCVLSKPLTQGPHDNVFVNTYRLGSHFRAVTDSMIMLDFDPVTLRMNGLVTFNDTLDANMIDISSAHPLPLPGTDCIVNVEPQQDVFGLSHRVNLFKLCSGAPATRVLLNQYKTAVLPYMHSWGLTSQFAVLPHQHAYLDMLAIAMWGKTIAASFVEESSSDSSIMCDTSLGPPNTHTHTHTYIHTYIHAYIHNSICLVDIGSATPSPVPTRMI